MRRQMLVCVALLLGQGVAAAATDISKMNGSIRVERGERAGNLKTMNGSIALGDEAQAGDVATINGEVRLGTRTAVGHVKTVNGGVLLDDEASAAEIETVNGEIVMRSAARVRQGVTAVNGSIELAGGAAVEGPVENVNGRIEIDGATVGGRVRTVVGDIEIGSGSRIAGGLLVEEPDTWGRQSWGGRDVPRVVIGPGATVEGTLVFEHEVELYVSDRATVGAIEGATAIRFSGDRP